VVASDDRDSGAAGLTKHDVIMEGHSIFASAYFYRKAGVLRLQNAAGA
jgi:hypothetical protein